MTRTEKQNEQKRQWYERNRETVLPKMKLRAKERYMKDPSYVARQLEYAREKYAFDEDYRQRKLAYNREYYAKNKERLKEKRKAKKLNTAQI